MAPESWRTLESQCSPRSALSRGRGRASEGTRASASSARGVRDCPLRSGPYIWLRQWPCSVCCDQSHDAARLSPVRARSVQAGAWGDEVGDEPHPPRMTAAPPVSNVRLDSMGITNAAVAETHPHEQGHGAWQERHSWRWVKAFSRVRRAPWPRGFVRVRNHPPRAWPARLP